MNITPKNVAIIGLDLPFTKNDRKEFARGYLITRGADILDRNVDAVIHVDHSSILGDKTRAIFSDLEDDASIHLFLYPTRTYSEGFGGSLLSGMAPEDRVVNRALEARYPGRVRVGKIPLQLSSYFGTIQGYFSGDAELAAFTLQKNQEQKVSHTDAPAARSLVGFDMNYFKNMEEIFRSCMTSPNRQDFFYLATKTFGVNLAVRVGFAAKGVLHGDLPLERAVIATSWYQIQDIVFTIFGQTYMKFLGRMTGLLRVSRAYIGDFLFVYVQFCFFEFVNRLLLGPIGENPLVYTWQGIGLILLNNFQGLISGGPLVPAINKIRKAGVISHSMMMHLYQLGSLSFYFGMFASFGYQKIYFALTTGVMVFAWSSYLIFSTFYKDPTLVALTDKVDIARLDAFASKAYSSI